MNSKYNKTYLTYPDQVSDLNDEELEFELQNLKNERKLLRKQIDDIDNSLICVKEEKRRRDLTKKFSDKFPNNE